MEIVWCVLVTTCIGICFKLYGIWKVDIFNSIVVNYTICLIIGSWLSPGDGWPFTPDHLAKPWIPWGVGLGVLFISGFNLTAYTIQQAGITLTTLIQRMSLILTVSFTVIFFGESFGKLEAIGLVFAILAILAINQKGHRFSFQMRGTLPLLLAGVLLMSASIEILLYHVEKSGLVGQDQVVFTTFAFGIAAIIGWSGIGLRHIKGIKRLTSKDVLAGMLLGVPNFFSIYLLLVLLNQGWKGSILYPMVNVCVLLASTGAAVLIFSEKLTRVNWVGIGLATLSIIIIGYAHNAKDWTISF